MTTLVHGVNRVMKWVSDRTVRGKFVGAYFKLNNGQEIYLHFLRGAKNRNYLKDENSFCIDNNAIHTAQRKCCKYIGIRYKVGKDISYYITDIEDFLSAPPHYNAKKEPMRKLNVTKFKINTNLSSARIKEGMKLKSRGK